jgi:ferredoxin--NADP+ reductase/benzoate/toluate 1,2-dioxygenase reductase subunit
MDKNNFQHLSGQYLSLGLPDDVNMREYSIYSGVNDPFLEVLIREVEEGDVSVLLKKAKAGQALNVEGPYGFFTLKEQEVRKNKFLFLATGTGISPFHSFVRSYPDLDYNLIHGIRLENETYEKESYPEDRYFSAISKSDKGNYQGRLTTYLKEMDIEPDTLCFLCGNVDMIHDAYDILQEKGIAVDQIHSEVYF